MSDKEYEAEHPTITEWQQRAEAAERERDLWKANANESEGNYQRTLGERDEARDELETALAILYTLDEAATSQASPEIFERIGRSVQTFLLRHKNELENIAEGVKQAEARRVLARGEEGK